MNNRNGSLSVVMAVLFEIIVIITAIVYILSGQRREIYLYIIAIVSLIFPFIISGIASRRKILLPSSFQIVTLVFIFLAQYLGEIKNFYDIFLWWDLMLHGIFGSYGVVIGLHSIQGIIKKEVGITEERFAFFSVVFACSVTIALGVLWETFEFTGDYIAKSNMVKGGLADTMTDLIVKVVFSVITSVIFYRKLKDKPL